MNIHQAGHAEIMTIPHDKAPCGTQDEDLERRGSSTQGLAE